MYVSVFSWKKFYLGEYTQAIFSIPFALVYVLLRAEEKTCATQVKCSGYGKTNAFFC